MGRESKLFDLLERLGFNTTRLRWKLYKWEQRRENRQGGIRLPTVLHWLQYPHKHCMHCGKLVEGDARVCPQCDRRLPSLYTYRVMRLLGLVLPENAPATVIVFLAVMVAVYLVEIAMQGPSAIMSPTRLTLLVFGAWNPQLAINDEQYWRYLSFGLGHIGLWHIGFNGIALMQVGPVIESYIEKARMLVLITVTQLTAAFASQFWYHHLLHSSASLTAGASGWLFGLIGFGIALFWSQGGTARVYRDLLIKWAIYALVFGFLIHANNAAHVGGMLGGFALGFVPEGTRRTPHWGYLWKGTAWVSAGLWLVTAYFLVMSILVNWTPGGVPAP